MKNQIKLVIVLAFFGALASCKTEDLNAFKNGTLPLSYDNQGTLTVKNTKLKITYWDYSAIDGDVIDIIVNGKTIVSNKAINATKESFDVTLPKGENWIGIKAIDEGYNPPASPHIEFDDGKTVQAFDILAYINEPGGYSVKVVL
jgi:hypothetical protein